GRLDVAVQQPGFVQETNAIDQLPEGGEQQFNAFGNVRELLKVIGEWQAIHQFHDQAPVPVNLEQFMDGGQVGMAQVGDCSELLLEAKQFIRIEARQALDRHVTAAEVIRSPIDHAHAAVANLFE